jgi:glycosyltransferase involved in cell wall biosynthesis
VVASDLPVFQEYLTDGDDALLAKVGDSEDLAAAMRRVATDEHLRERLRSHARRMSEEFTWDKAARLHRELYGRERVTVP